MIRKEIVLPATRDDVWEALTDAERLEDWFANDVELDLRPGRRRELPLVERRGAARDRDRGGAGAAPRIRLGGRGRRSSSRSTTTSTARGSVVVESSPAWSTALELQASAFALV